MRHVIVFALLVASCTAQGIGGKAGVGGKGGFGGATASGGATVAFQGLVGSNNFGGTTATAVFGTNTAAGNNVVACGVWAINTGSGITVSFSDSQGHTYTTDTTTRVAQIGTVSYGEIGIECGHSTAVTIAAADTVTCTFSSSVTGNFCHIFEVNPNGGTLTLDQHNNGTGTAERQRGVLRPCRPILLRRLLWS